jgi:hypothetical protein
MHGIPPCSITCISSRQELYYIRPSPIQSDATIFARFNIALFRQFLLAAFSTFSTFRLSDRSHSFLTFYSSFFNRPSLVASNSPSDRPRPLFTSVLCGRCGIHRCRNILTSGEQKLGNPGTPHLHLFINHLLQPRAMKLPIGQWDAIGH